MAGLALLAALIPLAPYASPLAFAAAATLVLVIVAVWETRSLRGNRPHIASRDSLEASSPHHP
jgi:hypothetical protein